VTFRQVLTIMVMLTVIAMVTAFALSRQSYADEYVAPCQDAEEAVHRLVAGGALDLGRFELPTRTGDAVVFIEFRGYVMAILTRKGCIASGPAIVDLAKDRGSRRFAPEPAA
jgi:hypothetical protein